MTHRTLLTDTYKIHRLTLTEQEHTELIRGTLGCGCKGGILARYGIGPVRTVTTGEDGSVTYESRYRRIKP